MRRVRGHYVVAVATLAVAISAAFWDHDNWWTSMFYVGQAGLWVAMGRREAKQERRWAALEEQRIARVIRTVARDRSRG